MTTLPAFPTDPATLDALEHSLGAAFGPDHELTGADFTLRTLLDAYAGSVGDDPDAEVLVPGVIPGVDEPRVTLDTRPSYHPNDVIAALIAVVKGARELADDWEHTRWCEWDCHNEMADELRKRLGLRETGEGE